MSLFCSHLSLFYVKVSMFQILFPETTLWRLQVRSQIYQTLNSLHPSIDSSLGHKPPLLLHSRIMQFSFNCPQQVKGKSHCFTLKWMNTNNCFRNSAEWSVRPDIIQTVVKTLSLISAVYFCSCRSLRNSYLDISNR